MHTPSLTTNRGSDWFDWNKYPSMQHNGPRTEAAAANKDADDSGPVDNPIGDGGVMATTVGAAGQQPQQKQQKQQHD